MELLELRKLLQNKIQLSRVQKHLRLTNEYEHGVLVKIELRLIYPDSLDFVLLSYSSKDGKDFKNNLASSQSDNSITLFDKESKERHQREYDREVNKQRTMWFGGKDRPTYTFSEKFK